MYTVPINAWIRDLIRVSMQAASAHGPRSDSQHMSALVYISHPTRMIRFARSVSGLADDDDTEGAASDLGPLVMTVMPLLLMPFLMVGILLNVLASKSASLPNSISNLICAFGV